MHHAVQDFLHVLGIPTRYAYNVYGPVTHKFGAAGGEGFDDQGMEGGVADDSVGGKRKKGV